MTIDAPFPYFGGKSRIADEVWDRFGDVPNYVEPFAGSLAVLLARPSEPHIETVNDLDGMIANFWRAVTADPEAVAYWADWPVNEVDLHARHLWLVGQREDMTARLMADPDWCDAKIAGWWVWGICSWIGSGFCSGDGDWIAEDGEFRQRPHLGNDGQGVHRKLPHLGDAGRGVHRQLPHLGDDGRGVHRQLPHLGNAGQGVHRQLPHLGDAGQGVLDWFTELAQRLRRVRVCCGDWSRVCGPTPTVKQGLTGVFLDPPYTFGEREADLYVEDNDVAAEVRAWAIEQGTDPRMRIALCGYEGEHEMPADWECMAWKATGGYASQGDSSNENAARERVWFSPHCLKVDRPRALGLFESLT